MCIRDSNYSINAELREESLSDIMPDQFTRTVMIEIDLASGTDEEIAESLKAALPQWRKIKGIDENPLESVRFGYGTIKKLISYRVIPMLDILVWAAVKKIRVSDDRLSRLLYTCPVSYTHLGESPDQRPTGSRRRHSPGRAGQSAPPV